MGIFAIASLISLSAWACPKYFQPFNVPVTAIEKATLTFAENEFGPELNGFYLRANGKEAVGLFFGGRKKNWCAVLKDKKEGTSLDCNFLYHKDAGLLGSGNVVWVGVPGSKDKPSAVAVHTDPTTLTIYTLDPKKPFKAKDPLASVDTTKHEIVLKGSVEVSEKGTATAHLELLVWDVAAGKSVAKAVHSVEGKYSVENAQITRMPVREAGPPPPAKPLAAQSLIGQIYTGPFRCGYGEVAKYTPPAGEGQDRLPAKSQ